MAKDLYNSQIRDTSTHTSGEIGADHVEGVFQLSNRHDQSIDYTFEGTYDGDSDFSDAVQLGSGTVSAGGTARERLTEPWDVVRLTATASTAPTSGELVVKYHVED